MVTQENNNVKHSIYFTELPHFIAKPPSSVTVKEKESITLPCNSAGFPHPVITWYKNGHQIDDERKQFNKKDLEIRDIQFDDRGIYTCTAENLLGRVELSVNVTVEGMYRALFPVSIIECAGTEYNRSVSFIFSEKHLGPRMGGWGAGEGEGGWRSVWSPIDVKFTERIPEPSRFADWNPYIFL